MHKMLNVNDYFQVAMRSGKMHSECGGPDADLKAIEAEIREILDEVTE
jgi:hypothetical protein